MSKSSLLKGAILLTVATFLSKLLGSVFRIPLQNIAGDEVLGIFSVVYPVYMSILIITVAGIPLAISKLISEARAKGRDDDVYFIYRTATILGVVFGVVSFILMFVLAEWIAGFLGGSLMTYSILAVSVTLIFAPYMAVYRGFFQGYEDMVPTAVSQVLEQFVRVLIIIVAAYYLTIQAFAPEVVSAGVMIGSVVGVLASLVYLKVIFARRKPIKTATKMNKETFSHWAKRILIVALPICFGALTMALLNVVDSLTIPRQLSALGNTESEVAHIYGTTFGRGQALVQMAVVFASALILPLIPAITKALATNDKDRASMIVDRGNTITHLTAWPAAMGLAALTVPINYALFGDVLGSDVIFILSVSALFTSFSVLTTGMLQGANREFAAAIIVLVCSAAKFVLNIILVAQYGMIGAAISTLIVYVAITILNVYILYRTLPFPVVRRSHALYALASVVMGAVLLFAVDYLQVELWTRLNAMLFVAAGVVIGAIIYVVILIGTKAIDDDIASSLPLLSKLNRRK
ncbi:polysaccharide biosynthesis/transport protein [Alkalihalophilus pseudofirmus]|uniref:putative polysaccharide biosynthesis protein n=1 Tax=Alkalihalophilus pseudofirmus TaxID=79885 RepID=UPI000950E41D|nr:polysaccharide biosynthesis/transport protein [Alkalihalophilus pseudofirmus]